MWRHEDITFIFDLGQVWNIGREEQKYFFEVQIGMTGSSIAVLHITI